MRSPTPYAQLKGERRRRRNENMTSGLRRQNSNRGLIGVYSILALSCMVWQHVKDTWCNAYATHIFGDRRSALVDVRCKTYWAPVSKLKRSEVENWKCMQEQNEKCRNRRRVWEYPRNLNNKRTQLLVRGRTRTEGTERHRLLMGEAICYFDF